ncbi:MAG: hypothetical protein IGR76_01195 [Synechococcales cyanobacterium T60_A2020_003]|nr:hypothetical protein [Synechococcales cyanobacterium T60_A2020_003]
MRTVLAVVVCGVMLFSIAMPAYAIGSSKSKPYEGEAQLNEVQRRSEDVLKAEPRSMNDLKETAQGGINEIQGAADYDKMSWPENSQDAESVPDQIKRAFDALTDR